VWCEQVGISARAAFRWGGSVGCCCCDSFRPDFVVFSPCCWGSARQTVGQRFGRPCVFVMCVCVCVCGYMHICNLFLNTRHASTCLHAQTSCLQIYACMCMCVCVCVCVCIYIHMLTYIHIYIHMHTSIHTYMHTYIHAAHTYYIFLCA
jgi:hypothetical protein